MKRPDIDLGACSLCMGCVEICAAVFRYNDAGYIEIIDLPDYPEEEVNDIIMLCPENCIEWIDE